MWYGVYPPRNYFFDGFANKNVFSAAFATESVSAVKVDLITLFIR